MFGPATQRRFEKRVGGQICLRRVHCLLEKECIDNELEEESRFVVYTAHPGSRG